MSITVPPIGDLPNMSSKTINQKSNMDQDQLNFEIYLLRAALGTVMSPSENSMELYHSMRNQINYQNIQQRLLNQEPQVSFDSVSEFAKNITGGAKSIALGITSLFEGGKVAGNFDGQGLSMGVLQWNIGSGTLQPLLREMASKYPDEWNQILGEKADDLKGILGKSQEEQLSWAKSINQGNKIVEPWKSSLNQLLQSDHFKEIEKNHSKAYQNNAEKIMKSLGIETNRSYALAFDIAVQNGSLKNKAKELIDGAMAGKSNALTNVNDISLSKNQREIVADLNDRLKETKDPELRKLYYTAAAVAITSREQFAKDVWQRKSTIVAGEGTVHGRTVELNKGFGLNDGDIQLA